MAPEESVPSQAEQDPPAVQRKNQLAREQMLAPLAARGEHSQGRARNEARSDGAESPFQIDRARIVRSKAFRRLMHKTQVFIAPMGDHYLTRLTHTMEVASIARAIARGLNLNEDLTEAICMGHDVGHSPFGHLGERTLAELYPGGFRHNRQSVRVVEILENNGLGLNLTWEVRQGILKHSKGRGGIEGNPDADMDTLEAQICKLADAMSYVTHDTDDAIRAGVLEERDLPGPVVDVIGRERSNWGSTFAQDIVHASWACSVATSYQLETYIHMSPLVSAAANHLREFLFQRVYEPASAGPQAERAMALIRLLYQHFARHAEQIPAGYSVAGETPERMALDYVSGMTDSYALHVAETLQPGVTTGFAETGAPLSLPGAVK